VDFAVTDEPWTLPVDAIVVSAGGGFGGLAQAVAAQSPPHRMAEAIRPHHAKSTWISATASRVA
jgi:hypothetical protein